MENLNTINVKTAIEIFDQSLFKNTSNFLRDAFSLHTNTDCELINIPALKSKLHRYKSMLKIKRGNAKEQYENESFTVPTHTAAEGNFKKFEHSVYKETCEKLALELNEVKKQTTEEITKSRFDQANEFAKSERIDNKEILQLKRSHSFELSQQGKKSKTETNKKSSKIKTLSAKINHLNGNLNEISKRKEALRYKNVLLQRKLSRASKLKLCNSNIKKLENIICKERNKVSDCLREINALKDQNMAINNKLVKANETIANMSNKIHCIDNDKLDKLRAEIKDLKTDRDYLHSLLQDNIETELLDPQSNTYNVSTRQCIMNLTSYNVSSQNVGPVIEEVLKLVGKKPNSVPSRKTVDNIVFEKIAVGHRQLTTVLGIPQNTCLYGDETRTFGKTYQTFLVSDESQTVYFLGLREMVDKAARTTMNTFIEILNDITDMCQTYKSNHISSRHDILVNIKNFMSDRAQTNIAFCALLEDYRSQILPKFIPT